MQSTGCAPKLGLTAKRTWRRNIFQTRLALFKHSDESPHNPIAGSKHQKLKNMLGSPETPSTHRTPRGIKIEQVLPLKTSRRYTYYKSCIKQSACSQKANQFCSTSFMEEKESEGCELSNRKRRVTQGSMVREIKQIPIPVVKRQNLKQTKKVNYEHFKQICFINSISSASWEEGQKVLELNQVLGVGAFSEVREGRSLHNKYAVKIYQKQKCFSKAKKQRIYTQINILSRLPPHRNIVSLVSAYESKTQIHLIFELIDNSQNLQSFIDSKSSRLTDRQRKIIFSKIVKGVAHLHSHGISHRDLKPSNVIIAHDEDNQITIKIIDFGIASDKPQSDLRCGTPNFVSPEQLRRCRVGNAFQADVWALGVILFYLSESRYPFVADTEMELYKKIKEGRYEFIATESRPTRDLIQRLLEVNVHKRISIQELVRHSWFY